GKGAVFLMSSTVHSRPGLRLQPNPHQRCVKPIVKPALAEPIRKTAKVQVFSPILKIKAKKMQKCRNFEPK
ncbi:hypothetical protein MJ257_22910, partial [Paenibacillus timonensis]|uniref:hypothetical protein n=1 Tax=Paenibacillus timonensis TaxID=225915 RepID=UPI001F06E553